MPDDQPRVLMRTDDHSYSVLIHLYGEHNQLVDVLPCPIFGFLVGPNGPEFAVSLRGTSPIHSVPIWAPDGCVHLDGRIFPDYDTYKKWAEKGMQ